MNCGKQSESWLGHDDLFANLKRCNKKSKRSGPITTEETEAMMNSWIQKSQKDEQISPKFEEDRARLNLQENGEVLLECRGRIPGDFPIYLPDTSLFSEKLVADAHKETGESVTQ